MESLNRAALELVEEGIEFADELRIDVHHLDNEAAVLDFGVHAPGGFEAGLLLAEIQTGGLATVQTRLRSGEGSQRTNVELVTDHPQLALLGAGVADWRPGVSDAVGSGPARLFDPEARFRPPTYEETFEFAVLTLEGDRLPEAPTAETVASTCGVPTSGVFMPAFRLGSLAGSVSMAAKAAQVALLRLDHLGYDTTAVRSAAGSAPVAPVASDRHTALVRTNDAIAFGGDVHLVVEEPVDRIDEVPYAGTANAGDSLRTVFEDADWDLQAIPPGTFAPATVTIDVVGGDTHTVGERRTEQIPGSKGE